MCSLEPPETKPIRTKAIRQAKREFCSIPHASREHYLPPCQEVLNKFPANSPDGSTWFQRFLQSNPVGQAIWASSTSWPQALGDSWLLVTYYRSDFPKCLCNMIHLKKNKYIKHFKHMQTKSANGYKWAHWCAYTCQIIAKWVGHKLLVDLVCHSNIIESILSLAVCLIVCTVVDLGQYKWPQLKLISSWIPHRSLANPLQGPCSGFRVNFFAVLSIQGKYRQV